MPPRSPVEIVFSLPQTKGSASSPGGWTRLPNFCLFRLFIFFHVLEMSVIFCSKLVPVACKDLSMLGANTFILMPPFKLVLFHDYFFKFDAHFRYRRQADARGRRHIRSLILHATGLVPSSVACREGGRRCGGP